MVIELSGKTWALIYFLSGIVFSVAVSSILQGNYIFSIIAFFVILIVVALKKFIDWDLEE